MFLIAGATFPDNSFFVVEFMMSPSAQFGINSTEALLRMSLTGMGFFVILDPLAWIVGVLRLP